MSDAGILAYQGQGWSRQVAALQYLVRKNINNLLLSMEEIFQPICSIYLIGKTGNNNESENECSHCKKQKQSESESQVSGKPIESVISTKKNFSEYLYQSSNAICLQNPPLYFYSRNVPNYYLKQ